LLIKSTISNFIIFSFLARIDTSSKTKVLTLIIKS